MVITARFSSAPSIGGPNRLWFRLNAPRATSVYSSRVGLAVLVLSCVLAAPGVGRTNDSPSPVSILPANGRYAADVPSPKDVLGWEIGSRHLHHHELVNYLKILAQASPRVELVEYAMSYGGRPLVMLVITSPENHRQLDRIRRQHAALASPGTVELGQLEFLPVVIQLAYSVHGNEASGGNAAPLMAYYLAASQLPEVEQWLQQSIVLLDPCLNPDGFERFAQWVNDHRGLTPNSDSRHREHSEPWPSGRTNYYWFDLNRDWLPAQHPESQGRLRLFHQWKPNVLLDVHEMGSSSTFFFQPGVPTRNHPLTPDATFALTNRFAKNTAAALDALGTRYFTEERFDDFYMGKGSTYPDLHGAVGILFEQASTRGLIHESPHGTAHFTHTIRNQWVASLAGIRSAVSYRKELLEHQQTFFADALALARADKTEGYLVAAAGDPHRLEEFVKLLRRHDLTCLPLTDDVQVGQHRYRAGQAYWIPCDQPEYRFLKSLFERRTTFEEPVFYDVSAWTLPMAFHLQWDEVPKGVPVQAGNASSTATPANRGTADDRRSVGFAIDWRNSAAPAILYQLLDQDVRVYVASSPFTAATPDGERSFGYGTLFVPLLDQKDKEPIIRDQLTEASKNGVSWMPVTSGLTPEGIDLGSSRMLLVPKPRVLIVADRGLSSGEVGEAWFALDRRVRMPVTLARWSDVSDTSLNDYTTVVLASGTFGASADRVVGALQEFVSEGGTLLAMGTAIRWLQEKKFAAIALRPTRTPSDENEPSEQRLKVARRPYDQAATDQAKESISGAIVIGQVDPSHPICYGYAREVPLPLFRTRAVFLDLPSNAYSAPVVYRNKDVLASGYLSERNQQRIAGGAAVAVYARGRGRMILMADDPNFRAFWLGTQRLFVNSVFFGPLVRVP